MNSTSEYAKKICRYLKDSNYRKVINCHLGMYNNMSDEKYLKMLFHAQIPQKPSKFDEMLEISRKLSSGTPFLRVDLYEINGRVYFGELTFYPCAGMMPFDPPEADLLVGNMLDLTSWGL